MANIVKDFPEVGDIVIIQDGKKKFIRGSEVAKDDAILATAIGVVYNIQGKLVRIVGGKNDVAKQWSCVADYEITAIPSASGDYAVTLCGASVGNFSYTKSEGTIAEFTTQLNTWLSTHATKWEAYTRNGHSYLQMKTYNTYESSVSIASATLVKLIGSELENYTISTGARNAVKQYTTYNAMCYQRMLDRAMNDTTANSNPTTRMNGTTQLFVTLPCSKMYYDGELGDGLRANFSTYEDYIRACMVVTEDIHKGMMQFRDGSLMTNLLKDKTILKNGVETYAYSSARYAYDYDSGVSGYGQGTFWLPSMYELSLLMRDITYNTSAVNTDAVSVALSKKTGWSLINPQSHRWSSARCNSAYACYFSSTGFSSRDSFYYSLACSVVSAFYLD